eukprot:TRINITY_DN2880_c0_g1_i2.p1 TRINITY_DN2880_c0_g1~~TRINITY_DN2880_c0_g1_i2.p1  ORF type:complete len:839 (+),score=148.47 TRINITY_DN2880_c0_g1_i2:75-2591(+)
MSDLFQYMCESVINSTLKKDHSMKSDVMEVLASDIPFKFIDIISKERFETGTTTLPVQASTDKHENIEVKIEHKIEHTTPVDTKSECDGHQNNSSNTSGIFQLPLAPTFYPTAEEFQDPWKYLLKIKDEAKKSGICVIQPPDNSEWDFDSFTKIVNPNRFMFYTKAQNVHQMQQRSGPNMNFYRALRKYWLENDLTNPTILSPQIGGVVVDFYKLKLEIEEMGGVNTVDNEGLWFDLAKKLRLISPNNEYCSRSMLSMSNTRKQVKSTLRSYYFQFLHPFLKELKKNPGLIEDSLKASKKSTPDSPSSTSSVSAPSSPAQGGVKRSSPDSGVGINSPNKKQKLDNSDSVSESETTSVSSKSDTDENSPLWSQVKYMSFAKDANCDVMNGASKAAKANRKNASNIGQRGSKKNINDDEIDFGYEMGKKFTLFQFKEMASSFEDRWPECYDSEDEMKDNHPLYTKGGSVCPNLRKIEQMYWDLVEGGKDFVQVQYGSDLDIEAVGSGFPLNPNGKIRHNMKRTALRTSKNKNISDYMIQSGWNTNNLAESTFLHHLNESVGGVTRPMLYVGMMFSSFCWHVEDNYLYSVNYLHTGKPKLWYGIPSDFAHQFEAAMKKELPELFEKNPNLLHLLVTQLSPQILKKHGVPVYTALQKEGQFVITFPKAYHAGFNTGFNCAESVNFALEDWLPFCQMACNAYRFQRSAVFSYEEFVHKASKSPDNPTIARLLQSNLEEITNSYVEKEKKLLESGVVSVSGTEINSVNSDDNNENSSPVPCHFCGYDCYLAVVECTNHTEHKSCINHSHMICDCDPKKKRLIVHISSKQLLDTCNSLGQYIQTN